MSVFSDFDWSWRGVRVRETGAEIAFTRALAWDVFRGIHYIGREALRRRAPAMTLKVAFEPRAPRAWYLLWGCLRQAGIQTASPKETEIDLTIHFSDLTIVEASKPKGRTLNGHCTDISKSRVGTVFFDIFGYNLAIDPSTATEAYLEKSEENGVHDAEIHEKPRKSVPGRVYQKLIDNRTPDGTVLDFRCPTVFGDIPLVFLKERPIGKRFDNLNTRVQMAEPTACFSAEELAQIKRFCAAMDLDWGGLDILRHAADDKIYIVDVNKTDMGPPLSLPIKDKLSAVKTLGQALRDRLEERS